MRLTARMDVPHAPYSTEDLAWVHHQGFGFHAEGCAEEILRLLEPVRDRGGVVLELGCGSGLLTRHLLDAGLQVIATDASPAMLGIARTVVGDAAEIRQLVLPDDPLPPADAVISVGHCLNYLADEASVWRGLQAIAGALRPGGILAIDLCDLRWGALRRDQPPGAWLADDWAIITAFSTPTTATYVRDITTFRRTPDGSWRRRDERHHNVLVDTSRVPDLLAEHGVRATMRGALGDYELPAGLVAVVGERTATSHTGASAP